MLDPPGRDQGFAEPSRDYYHNQILPIVVMFPRHSRLCWRLLLCCLVVFKVAMAQPQTAPASPVHKLDGSFVRDWLVLGPFPARDLETDLLADAGGEANIRPQEGDSVTTKEGKKLTWTRLRSKYDLADAAQVFDGLEWSVVYAYCEVGADEPIDTDARLASWIPASFSWNGKAFLPFPVSERAL